MPTRVPRYVAPSSINATRYKRSYKCEHTHWLVNSQPKTRGGATSDIFKKKKMAGWLAGLGAHLIEVALPNEKKKKAHHTNYLVEHQAGVRSHGAATVCSVIPAVRQLLA